ncbi:LysR family transcriptional regulator [Streptomyces sp. NPDC059455]|uniref:LysR family transcriptional regulator n=1 Tax=Streptomyces sp. NPDC059455 TaxID=3346837 RepID=UPI0036C7CCA1
MPPPSLSQQIVALEKHLGVQLFTRTSGGVTVTMAGRAFLAEAEIATTAARRAVLAARAASGELACELIIAVHMGLGARQLPLTLGRLRHRHPKLQVILHEEPDPTDMERPARQGTLDMVLVHRIPTGRTFDIHPLGEETYVAVLPEGHPLLASDRALRMADLATQGWVRFRRASLLDEYLARLLADTSISPPTARPFLPSLTEPVIVGTRRHPDSAEAAVLDHLHQRNWCGTSLLAPHTAL